MIKLIIPLVVFVCGLIFSLSAQKYNFRNYSVTEGLSQSQIFTMCEDHQGYLWFGSQGGGLIRFDGYKFTIYSEEDGLPNNFIRCIFRDNNNILWIGTEEGIATFDGLKFTLFNPKNGPGTTIVRTIFMDKKGRYWFGTEGSGLFLWSGNKMQHFTTDNGLSHNIVFSVNEDKSGKIWIGTQDGACSYDGKNLKRYSRKDGLANNVIRHITRDKQGNLWFSTYGGGITRYDYKEFTTFTVKDGLCNNTVFCVFCDEDGDLWIGTAIGVSRFDGEKFYTYDESTGLASNVVVDIIRDSWGNLWFGTSGGGVSKLDNERFVHFTQSENMGKWVFAVGLDHEGASWFGTSLGGVTRYDGKTYELLRGNQGFTPTKIRAIYSARDSSLWFGTTNDGLIQYREKSVRKFTKSDGLKTNFIVSFAEDSAGFLWFASLDAGVGYYNPKTRLFRSFKTDDGIAENRVYAIATDKYGNIWAGTSGGGVNKIIPSGFDSIPPQIFRFTKNEGLSSNTIRSIICDTMGNVFFGTAGGGLNIYNGEKFLEITKKDGLSSNNIYTLVFDWVNNLWVGTERGLDKITFNEKLEIVRIKHYGRNEGFTGVENCRNAVAVDSIGNIWFGTVSGATRYDPREDFPNNVAPKTRITKIKLFFDNILETGFVSEINSKTFLPDNLELPYDQNHISFEFTGICQRNPDAVRYKWILEGLDRDWSPVLDQREATYSNIPPGTYTFKLLACNEDGIWNEQPVTFTFTILHPYWQALWFRLTIGLVAFAFVVVIFLLIFYSIRKKNIKEKERLKMEKNILELEQEAARLQMNPHFIFNSLNSIQGFIAVNDQFQAKRYLAKFARLMRLILENAREEFIPLANEIEILSNYLDLEKLSTNNKFEYTIEVAESADPEMIEIPPMMIQPFVENAIIHGIKKKEGNGNISLHFLAKDGLLECTIKDDGVGRAKAAETTTNAKHKSSGMSVTRKRLEQLRRSKDDMAGIEVFDLKNDEGIAFGTKVVVKIPFVTD
ncbi:MAG: hypothetical protein A2W91_14020 [Bacteroidetes bacterium GWF2_38_335]|nr:MAG: hypothetical protein A2W91_14020 [Bacteroidetes bacterium GWF2_38_335]OFY77831.1 MAG: hypothetical protein A2281_15710 [Bacteroidetes bacterium RIFOXYA12_FULL_38_20]HBS87361.1 hypothetical protein [Bacteroidales bacterium]